jgi:leader peptidase (prepilin peptidase) / N-methyltransferase
VTDLPAWMWPVLIAPFIGSFIGVLVTRTDTPGSMVMGRSVCESCGAVLGAGDLVPVVSYLAAKGRCRYCGKRIGIFHLLIELAAVGIALWAATVGTGAILWAGCVLGWALLALAAIDLKYYLLPDFLTLPLIPMGVLATALFGQAVLLDHVIGAASGFGFAILLRTLYRQWRGREGMGLGDVKLLAASGAWVSWQGLPSVILIASFTGLVFAALRPRRGVGISLTDRIAFGAFLCVGTWIVWLYGPLVLD